MFNWLKKWGGAAPAPQNPPTPNPHPPAAGVDWPAADHGLSEFNVQTCTMQWLFSLGTVGGPPLSLSGLADAIERMSLETARAADWVPRVPSSLHDLLKQPADNSGALAIAPDTALATELLTEANLALHQRITTVTQLPEALRVLGPDKIKQVVARSAFRPVVGNDAGALTRAGAPKVGAMGEACAACSWALAPNRGVDPFEAFLAGLSLQVGHLVALRMADRVAHLARPDPHGLGPRSVPVGETIAHATDNQAAQDMVHAMAILSHRVAARWELPDNVVGAITAQADAVAQSRWPTAGELLGVAQEAARLRVLDQAGKLPAPLADCCLYLPDDAQAWLLTPPKSQT